MSASSALVVARARAQSRMVDSCTITRGSAETGMRDPVTGLRTPGSTTTIYSDICNVAELRVQNPSPTGVAADFPVSMVATLRLPALGPQIHVQDVVVLDAAPDHPQDVGMRFRITSFNPKTQAKARVFQMQSVIG